MSVSYSAAGHYVSDLLDSDKSDEEINTILQQAQQDPGMVSEILKVLLSGIRAQQVVIDKLEAQVELLSQLNTQVGK